MTDEEGQRRVKTLSLPACCFRHQKSAVLPSRRIEKIVLGKSEWTLHPDGESGQSDGTPKILVGGITGAWRVGGSVVRRLVREALGGANADLDFSFNAPGSWLAVIEATTLVYL